LLVSDKVFKRLNKYEINRWVSFFKNKILIIHCSYEKIENKPFNIENKFLLADDKEIIAVGNSEWLSSRKEVIYSFYEDLIIKIE